MGMELKAVQDLIIISIGFIALIFHEWFLDFQEKIIPHPNAFRSRILRRYLIIGFGIFNILLGLISLVRLT